MDEKQKKLWYALIELSGEKVAELFTNYLGNQVLDDGFRDFLIDEGVIDGDREDEDEESEDE